MLLMMRRPSQLLEYICGITKSMKDPMSKVALSQAQPSAPSGRASSSLYSTAVEYASSGWTVAQMVTESASTPYRRAKNSSFLRSRRQ